MSAEGGSSPLLLLLKATSKQAIDEFLCACNVERELLKGPGAARIADLAASFGITEVEATQLQQAGANLVTEAVYRRAADAEKIATLFGDLPETEEAQQLQKLLGRVLLHRYEQFRAESLALGGVSTMPKLNQMSWQVYRKPAANGSSVAVPAMLLSLVLGEGPGKAAREVNVEMSKEQLEAMLASLSKVKEQARALGASHSVARADSHSVARVVSHSCVPTALTLLVPRLLRSSTTSSETRYHTPERRGERCLWTKSVRGDLKVGESNHRGRPQVTTSHFLPQVDNSDEACLKHSAVDARDRATEHAISRVRRPARAAAHVPAAGDRARREEAGGKGQGGWCCWQWFWQSWLLACSSLRSHA